MSDIFFDHPDGKSFRFAFQCPMLQSLDLHNLSAWTHKHTNTSVHIPHAATLLHRPYYHGVMDCIFSPFVGKHEDVWKIAAIKLRIENVRLRPSDVHASESRLAQSSNGSRLSGVLLPFLHFSFGLGLAECVAPGPLPSHTHKRNTGCIVSVSHSVAHIPNSVKSYYNWSFGGTCLHYLNSLNALIWPSSKSVGLYKKCWHCKVKQARRENKYRILQLKCKH